MKTKISVCQARCRTPVTLATGSRQGDQEVKAILGYGVNSGPAWDTIGRKEERREGVREGAKPATTENLSFPSK